MRESSDFSFLATKSQIFITIFMMNLKKTTIKTVIMKKLPLKPPTILVF